MHKHEKDTYSFCLMFCKISSLNKARSIQTMVPSCCFSRTRVSSNRINVKGSSLLFSPKIDTYFMLVKQEKDVVSRKVGGGGGGEAPPQSLPPSLY